MNNLLGLLLIFFLVECQTKLDLEECAKDKYTLNEFESASIEIVNGSITKSGLTLNLMYNGTNEGIYGEWEWLYGKLSKGEYRIISKVLDFRGPGDFDEHYLSVEFTISN